MLKFSSKLNTSKLDRKLSRSNMAKGQEILATQIFSDVNPYIPFRKGTLRLSGQVARGGKALQWHTPYARRRFYEDAHFTTDGTGTRWDLKAKAVHTQNWVQALKKGTGL